MGQEIFERNLKAMEKWYPVFSEMIRETQEKTELQDDTMVSACLSEDGEIIFRIQQEERKLYLNGKRNARMPIKMWLDRLGKMPKYAPVFLFGVGSGLYLKALIQNTEKEVNIIVYEPSIRIFLTMLQEIDLAKEIEDRPIAFIVEGLNAEEFKPVMRKVLVLENLQFLKEEIHPNYKEWYAEELIGKVRLLQREVEAIMMNENTGQKFSIATADNVLHNMRYLCDGYHPKKLAQAIGEQNVAILVSAGPSLNKNIHELKKAKNKAFILAVDTAVKPLLKVGIRPDAFVTIDARKPLGLTDIKEAEDIPVVAITAANYKMVERQTGKKIFWDDGNAIADRVYTINGKKFSDVAMAGSVACCGFSMLFKMGFHTIILVGQDLAYTGNKSHADGTFQEKMPEEDTESMVTVKGNYVDHIPTRRDFRSYLEWFSDYIEGAKKHREIRVVNATEGGAFIEGTELCVLKEIIEEVCQEEICFSEKIALMGSEFTEEERKKSVEYLHSIPGEYEEIRKIAKQLEQSYRKLQKMAGTGKLALDGGQKLLKQIKSLTKKCRTREAYQLVDVTMTTAEYIIRSEYFYEGSNPVEEAKEIARKGILYSQTLQECVELLKRMAEETLLPIT